MDKSREEAAKRIFDRVLKDIKPNAEEIKDTTYRANRIMGLLGKIVPKDVELRIAGSIARSTNLKGDADIDIFMLFGKGVSKDRLVKLGLEYGKKAAEKSGGRYEIKYAEHPYIRLYADNDALKADLVPALKISDPKDMATAVDRTPLHTEFINSHFNDRQRDEVRLLKYLLKAHKIYGAEIKTGGFSGYMCELLIHHYGSLLGALDSVAKFSLPLVLDPRSRKEITATDLVKKFHSDFIVLDPVDKERNAAAGVSRESLGRFVIVASQFVAKPSLELFYGKGFSSVKVGSLLSKFTKDSGLDMFAIEASLPDKSEDVVFPQLRKVGAQIVDYLRRNGFTVYLSLHVIKGRKGAVIFLAPRQLLQSRMLRGPDIFIKNASRQFMERHGKSMGFAMDGSVIYALERSGKPTIESALRSIPKGMLIHKDIDLRKAKMTRNRVLAGLKLEIYAELLKKLTI